MIWLVLFIIYIVVAAARLLMFWEDATGAFGWPVLAAAWLLRMAWLVGVGIVCGVLYFILDLIDRTMCIFLKK